jgi:serine/threonine protein kinase/outer membrane protein OmpA-like peptidoglycan-associated protein
LFFPNCDTPSAVNHQIRAGRACVNGVARHKLKEFWSEVRICSGFRLVFAQTVKPCRRCPDNSTMETDTRIENSGVTGPVASALERPAGVPDTTGPDGTPEPAVSAHEQLSSGKLFGCFELERQLETGSLGVVWLANDYGVKRQAVQAELRFLPDSIVSDKAAVEKLNSDVRGLMVLKHSGILHVHDLVKAKGRVAIQMEHCEGESLSALRLTRPNQTFEVGDLGKWVRELCEALEYAHKEFGLIGGNIAPGNLIVDAGGRLKLKEFGIAKSITDAQSRSMAIGEDSETLPYKSPQCLAGQEPAITDDVYSLGATIYELLTSKPPFYGGAQVSAKIPPSMADRRVELGITGEAIPSNWEETVAACLAKDPLQRPKSAIEVEKRLQKVMWKNDVTAKPHVKSGGKSSVRFLVTRKPRLAIVGLIFISAAVSVTALLTVHPKTEPNRERIVVDAAPVATDAFLKLSSRRATPRLLDTALTDEQTFAPEASSAPVPQVRAARLAQLTPAPVPEVNPVNASGVNPPVAPEVHPATAPEASPTPAPNASPAPAPNASPTPASEVSRTTEVAAASASTPSPPLSRQEPATPGEKESASGAAILMTQQDSDATKDAVIKRINVFPAATAEKKANLIEKMYRARSIERLTVIPFDNGQAALHRAAAGELVKMFCSAEIRDKLSDPTTVLVVAGYADTAGRQEANLRISRERAENVGKILKEQVKVLNAIQTVAMGGTEVLDNARPDQNRAVEIWAVAPL